MMPINYRNYAANWKKEIRPQILSRAKNRCEFCGVPNYSISFINKENKRDWLESPTYNYAEAKRIQALAKIKTAVIVLTVAHLDHDIANNSHENLKALCQKCHNCYDMSNRVKNRKIV